MPRAKVLVGEDKLMEWVDLNCNAQVDTRAAHGHCARPRSKSRHTRSFPSLAGIGLASGCRYYSLRCEALTPICPRKLSPAPRKHIENRIRSAGLLEGANMDDADPGRVAFAPHLRRVLARLQR